MNYLPYDAFNGSLVEQDLIHVVGNEEPHCEAIKQMTIGDIRPQEVHATEVETPHIVADLQSTAEVLAAVPLALVAVLSSSSAAQRSSTAVPCRQQQLTPVQFMDKTYNMMMSKVKMKRPPCPLYSKRVETTKSQVHAIIKFYSFVPCVAT